MVLQNRRDAAWPIMLCTIASLVFISEAMAQKPPERELPRQPWHVANVWWQFEAPTSDFQSLSIDVSIDRDVPSTYNLYIAPIGLGELSGVKFYGGLQTNSNGWPSKELRERHFIGKGAIFSRWGEGQISLDFARGAPDTHYESAGYEGDFVSVRRAYPWTKGSYTYTLVKCDYEQVDGKDYTWMSVFVTAHATREVTYIGSLKFEGKDFTFWDRNSSFVEVYATAKIPRSEIPEVKITFGYPRVNGQPPRLKHASAYYPNRDSQASPDCATITADGSDVVVSVGKIFERDEAQRRHPLKLEVPGA